MGKRGTNQAKSINVAVPAESIGYWADRLAGAGISAPGRSSASAPSGSSSRTRAASRTRSWGRRARTRASPTAAATCPPSTRSAAPTARRPRVREPEPMDDFLREAFNAEHGRLRGRAPPVRAHRATATARCSSWSRSPTCRRARGASARARSTTTRSTSARPRTSCAVKDYIVGLGYTDVSDVKDRGYFFSVYLRTPGGALFELAYSTPQGFTIDESVDELGTHMCIPPHWEDRRSRDRLSWSRSTPSKRCAVSSACRSAGPRARRGPRRAVRRPVARRPCRGSGR